MFYADTMNIYVVLRSYYVAIIKCKYTNNAESLFSAFCHNRN